MLFGRYGYRRTSVDRIAAEAGLAKGTLYATFPSKDDIYRGACELVVQTFLARAERAREAESFAEQLIEMLEAKFGYVFELLHRGPHAAELLAASDQLSSEIILEADRAYLAMLTSLIRGAARSKTIELQALEMTAPQAALLLFRSAEGARTKAVDAVEHRRNVSELVQLFVAAVRVQGQD